MVFAFAMKPAHVYLSQIDMPESTGPSGWVTVKARERSASGAVVPLSPVRDQDDIDSCKEWAKTAGY